MKKFNLFLLTLLLLCATTMIYVGCSTDDLMGPNHPPVSNKLQAMISLGDNPASANDSVLINIPVLISGARSTGNPINYSWKIYRVRTGLLVDSTSGADKKIINKTFTTVDTLTVVLKVYGSGGASDTSSASMMLRVLNGFGTGNNTGDIFVHTWTLLPSGMRSYVVGNPKGRVTWGNKNNPGYTGTHTNWTNQTMSNTDTIPFPSSWKMTYACYDGTTIRYNYFGNVGDNNWSDATGSIFKTSYENTYTAVLTGGGMYPTSGAPGVIIPGIYGDTVARYNMTVDSLFIYPNNRWIANMLPTSVPWWEANMYNFARYNEVIFDGSGYGKIAIPLSLVRQFNNRVQLRFGGPQIANMNGSPLYNSALGMIDFQVIGPTAPAPNGMVKKAF